MADCTTRLVFLPPIQAWVFLFGEQLLRLDGESMFFQKKSEAAAAARSKGLSVAKNGCVSSDFSLNPNPGWRWANPYGG